MTARDFCYWLQGYFEITANDTVIDSVRAGIIRAHLNLVFEHDLKAPPCPVGGIKPATPAKQVVRIPAEAGITAEDVMKYIKRRKVDTTDEAINRLRDAYHELEQPRMYC